MAVAVPCTATAQTDDPAAGSPPGAVYQIPLEGARSDAAPRKRDSDAGPAGAGGSGGGSGGSTSGSTYRSENDFGSSSEVPGADAGRDDRSSGESAEGKGTKAAAVIPDSDQTADEGETSVPTAVWLLALIVLAGVGIGVLAVRSARGGS